MQVFWIEDGYVCLTTLLNKVFEPLWKEKGRSRTWSYLENWIKCNVFLTKANCVRLDQYLSLIRIVRLDKVEVANQV